MSAGFEPLPPMQTAQKSGLVTAVAIVNFVLGGLSLVCGCIMVISTLFWGGMMAVGDKTFKDEFGKAFEKAMKEQGQKGGPVLQDAKQVGTLVTVVLVVTAVVSLVWGILAVVGGIGVLKRKNWGRMISLGLAGLAALLAILAMVSVCMGNLPGIVSVLLYAAYAGFVFFALLKQESAREFA